MLISKKYKFIFIHIYKNAGTSITHALMPFAMGQWQRKAISGLKKIGIHLGPYSLNSHATASEIMSKMGRNAYKSYFSFAIVRNPWDWQVSLYSYMLKNTDHYQHTIAKSFRGFDEYIKWRCTQEVRYQRDFIFSKEGEKLVDFVGKYEQLGDDFQYACAKIGVTARLPKINVSKTRPYQDYYNEETKELVRRIFEPDIVLFGYNFE